MKTIKSQSIKPSKLVTKFMINRTRSGKMLRNKSLSVNSKSDKLQSQSLLKNSMNVNFQQHRRINTECQDYYQFYNMKRPRIKNVNSFLKINKIENKLLKEEEKKIDEQNCKLAEKMFKKSVTLEAKQNIRKINKQPKAQLDKMRSKNILCLYRSKQQKNKLVQRQMQKKFIKKFKQLIIAQEKLKELRKKSQNLDSIYLSTINKLDQINLRMSFKELQSDNLFSFMAKEILEDTSDSGSCKQIVEEYGLKSSIRI